jgi:hypothetical protein
MSWSRNCLIITAAMLMAGCAASSGRINDWVRPDPAYARIGDVYLMCGWMGISSSGLEEMARQLEQAGLRTHMYQEAEWRQMVQSIYDARNLTGAGGHAQEPLVLVGYSFGADNSLRVAHELQAARIGIDLVVTIDPVDAPTVPRNVKRCINIYESNWPWDAFPWFRGTPLAKDESATSTQLINWDVRVDRRDLLDPDGTDHFSIPKSSLVQAEVVANVLAMCPPRPKPARN